MRRGVRAGADVRSEVRGSTRGCHVPSVRRCRRDVRHTEVIKVAKTKRTVLSIVEDPPSYCSYFCYRFCPAETEHNVPPRLFCPYVFFSGVRRGRNIAPTVDRQCVITAQRKHAPDDNTFFHVTWRPCDATNSERRPPLPPPTAATPPSLLSDGGGDNDRHPRTGDLPKGDTGCGWTLPPVERKPTRTPRGEDSEARSRFLLGERLRALCVGYRLHGGNMKAGVRSSCAASFANAVHSFLFGGRGAQVSLAVH